MKILAILSIFCAAGCFGQTATSLPAKPRLIVLTDIGGDPDDQQSMVRLLLHSNAFKLEGLIATSRMQHGYDTRPELIEALVKGYAGVFTNLKNHAEGYPVPDSLQTLIKSGLGDPTKMGAGWESQASRWIINVVEQNDQEPVWICIWGGSRDLAQALWTVRDRRNKKEMTALINKIRVFAIADQDRWGYWINKNFPELFYIFAGSCGDRSCAGFRGQYQTGDQSMQDGTWIEANIRRDHGSLGALYPRNGASTNGMKEGDTPSFMYLYDNGLMVPDHPQWGGWGGRFKQDQDGLYVDAADDLNNDVNERYAVSRWRPSFQRDLQARLDWCRSAARDSANHHPIAIVNRQAGKLPIRIRAKPGELLKMDAGESSDPDGHNLQFHWWVYKEASSFKGPVSVQKAGTSHCNITLPQDMAEKTIHLILEVTDNGLPPLTSYRRIILSEKN